MRRQITETMFGWFCWISATILVASVACLLVFLLSKGWKSLGTELIFGSVPPLDAILGRRHVFDGLLPALAGTLSLVVLAVGLAVVPGVATGIYMAEFASPATKRVFNLVYDILATIPSILIGLFGFSVTIVLHRMFHGFYPCLLVSACALGFLVLPYLIRSSQLALENLDPTLRLTGLALGADHTENLFRVLLPNCLTGIGSGILLAIGRSAEDTAVIMLTGAVATAGLPRHLLGSFEALPFSIYTISAQYMNAAELAKGYGAALLLLCICMTLFLLSHLIRGGISWLTMSKW